MWYGGGRDAGGGGGKQLTPVGSTTNLENVIQTMQTSITAHWQDRKEVVCAFIKTCFE